MVNIQVEQAIVLFQRALERSDRAKLQLQAVMQQHEKQPVDIEIILAADKEMGDARTEVGNTRLRLHLMGATESIEPAEREFRRGYAETKELSDFIEDLGTLESAEEEYSYAQIRYYESEMQFRTMEEMYKKGRCGAGNLIAAFKEKMEAEATYKVAGARLMWVRPRSQRSSSEPTDDWPVM